MLIKQVICLIIVCSIFNMWTTLAYSEEILVFRDRQTISILSTSPDGIPDRKEIIKDAYDFKINGNGHFTMKNGSWDDGTWYMGRVDSSFNITKQALPSIPSDAESVVVSEDGKCVAWKKGTFASELIIEEYSGSESKTLRKISTDGVILTFSWSPNSDLLAYFWGPPEAVAQDGFSLMLLDMKNPEKEPMQIAPPSLPTRLTPGRSVPSWSPTGESILFEAEYRRENMFLGWGYIVSIIDHNLVPSLGGIWDQDGKFIRRLKRIGDPILGEFIVAETDVQSNQEKEYPGDKLKLGAAGSIGLSPSGRKIAYVEDKEVFVYDTVSKNTVSYGASQESGEFFWISPKD